ncbi:hypothetical protein [Microbacterium sp. 1P10AE]|uniref:hypothetical protein n=1 Tax=Microbacterium sp. 1P10AE TaxID=3132286 RepID=UPI0039A07996
MHWTPLDTTIDSVAGYLHRRRRSAFALTTGEAATLAIGVVRGCAAAPSRAAGGEWRLTAEGRPVLEDHPGGADIVTATVAVLDELVSLVDADVRPGFARLRDGVLTDPPPAWDISVRRLLSVVEPRPLVLGPLTPVADEELSRGAHEDSREGAETLLDRLRDAVRRVSPRALLVGVGVTVALVVGATVISQPAAPADARNGSGASLSSPSAGRSPGADETVMPIAPGGVATAGPEPAPEGPEAARISTPPSETSVPPDGDVRTAALALLRTLASCADDDCSSALWESRPPEALAPLDPTGAELDVIDDFGGVAVVRLTGDEQTQYVTLVRHNDRWLVRSLEEVADQPS